MIDVDRDDDAPEIPAGDEAAHTQAAIPPGLERAEQLLRAMAGPPRPISGPPPLSQQAAPRFYRRRWFVGLLTLLFLPLALLIMWTGPVFYRRKGELLPMPLAHKWLVTCLFGLLVLVRLVTLPHHVEAGDAPGVNMAQAQPIPIPAPAPIAVAAMVLPAASFAPPLVMVQSQVESPVSVPIGPSFDCAKARDGVGATICSDAGLRRIDIAFVQAFQALRHQLGEAQREALKQDAVAFHQYVLQTCNLPRAVTPGQNLSRGVPCIADAYRAKRADYVRLLGSDAQQEVTRSAVRHLALQARLAEIGALPVGSAVDGVYGPATRDAIARLQAANGLAVSGYLNDETAKLLEGGSAPTPRPAAPSAMPSFMPQGGMATPATGQATPPSPPAPASSSPALTPPALSQAPAPRPAVRRPALPACNARETKATLASVLTNSASRLDRIILLDWSNVRQTGERMDPQERTCTAHLFLNIGEEDVALRLFYPTPTSTSWLLQVN